MWIRQLKSLKKACLNIAKLSNDAFYTQSASFSEIFNRNDPDHDNNKYCSPEWVTGTFLPPTTMPALLPKQFLTSPTKFSRNRSMKRKSMDCCLDDGTIVTSKFNTHQKKQI